MFDTDTQEDFTYPVRKFDAFDDEKAANLHQANKKLAAVVIKLNWFLGTTYILERRRDDRSHRGELALFGGSVEDDNPNKDTFKKTAIEELLEETGIIARDQQLPKLASIFGYDENQAFASVVYLLEYPALFIFDPNNKGRPKMDDILAAQRKRRKENGDDTFGPPVKVRRIMNIWCILNWSNFTPITIYSLLASIRKPSK